MARLVVLLAMGKKEWIEKYIFEPPTLTVVVPLYLSRVIIDGPREPQPILNVIGPVLWGEEVGVAVWDLWE